MSESTEQPPISIKRGLGLSTLFGMGLLAERFDLNQYTMRYDGVEWQGLFWRRVRVDRTVHLSDIEAFTRSFTINPIFVLLCLFSALNLLAHLMAVTWWFNSLGSFAYVPWLCIQAIPKALGKATENMQLVMFLTMLFWAFLAYVFSGRYWMFSVPGHASIRFPMRGVSRGNREKFEAEFRRRWEEAKR